MTCTTVELKLAKKNEEYAQYKFDKLMETVEQARAELLDAKKKTKKAQREYDKVWGA